MSRETCKPARRFAMSNVAARRRTYIDFPKSSDVSAVALADAGFYYSGDRETVRCFSCKMTVSDWMTGDDPLMVHWSRSPDCPFIRATVDSPIKPDGPEANENLSHGSNMDSFEAAIRARFEIFVDELQEINDISDYLSKPGIQAITPEQKRTITALPELKQHRELVRAILQRGKDACQHFVQALQLTGQKNLCQLPDQLQAQLDPTPADVLTIDKYMTNLKKMYKKRICDHNNKEEELHNHQLLFRDHVPVAIFDHTGNPNKQKRHNFVKFTDPPPDKQPVTLEAVFSRQLATDSTHSVLLLGAAGMGKSALCYKILDQFCTDRWMECHKYVFLITLGRSMESLGKMSTADLLFDYSDIHFPEKQKNTLVRQLQERQKETLIIIDGYDLALPKDTETTVANLSVPAKIPIILSSLIQGRVLPKSQVLTTSRPTQNKINKLVGRVLELAPLPAQSLHTAIKKCFRPEEQPLIKRIVHQNSDIESLMRIPIHLQKFLSKFRWHMDRWNSDKSTYEGRKFPVCTEQLEQIVCHSFREPGNSQIEGTCWKWPSVIKLLGKLTKIAGQAMQSKERLHNRFTSETLSNFGLADEDATQCGLMASYQTQARDSFGEHQRTTYYFISYVYYEWIAALHIVKQPNEVIRNIIDRNSGEFDVILLFAVGILQTEEGRTILSRRDSMGVQRCQELANYILTTVVKSTRCQQNDGHLYALYMFYEGQFRNPALLAQCLTHEIGVLEIKDGMAHALKYYLSQCFNSGTCPPPLLSLTYKVDDENESNDLVCIARITTSKFLDDIMTTGKWRAITLADADFDFHLLHKVTITDESIVTLLEKSTNRCVCLYINPEKRSRLPLCDVHESLEELHTYDYYLDDHSINWLLRHRNIRVLTGLFYNGQDDVNRLLQKSGLQAVGLWVVSGHDFLPTALSDSHSVKCLILKLRGDDADDELLCGLLEQVPWLEELWVTFPCTARGRFLSDLAECAARHSHLRTLALMGFSVDINPFLESVQLERQNQNFQLQIFTSQDLHSDDIRQRLMDASAAVNVRQIQYSVEAMFYAPLLLSQFIFRCVPYKVKLFLRDKFVELA